MTYHNAIKYILTSPQRNGASGTGADSFERVRLICARLGSPEKRVKYIRFAGSNGKTVCQTMLESVLHAAGIKVGSLLMPVSAEPRENVRIGRVPLAMEDVVRYVSAIVAAVNELKSEETEKDESSNGKKTDLDLTPTKNEMIFLVALLAFRDADCDICLIECEHNSADPTKMLAPPYAAIICGAIPAENTREANKIRAYVAAKLAHHPWTHEFGTTLYVNGGTGRTLARLHALERGTESELPYTISYEDMEDILSRITAMDKDIKQLLVKEVSTRVHTFPAGLAALLGIMDYVGADEVVITTASIREGYLLRRLAREENRASAE